MSANLTPHNPTRFKEIHGIRLAPGSAVANLIVERLIQDPVSLEVGRFWYNTTDKKFKLASVDTQGSIVIQEFISAADLAKEIDDLKKLLASQDSGKGTDLIGFAGITDEKGQVAPKGTLTNVITDVYNKIKEASNSSGTLTEDLKSVEEGKGATLIGFSGINHAMYEDGISVPAGTVDSAIRKVDDKLTKYIEKVGHGNYLRTDLTADQSVTSTVKFKKNIIVDGDIIHNGQNLIAKGTTVELGDSVLLLNRNLDSQGTPSANAGLQVNRGKNGTNDLLIWNEAEKQLQGIKVTVNDEEEGDGTEVVTLEKIALASDLTKVNEDLTKTVNTAKDELKTKIEEAKTSNQNLSGELNQHKTDLLSTDANKGSALVGYSNPDKSGDSEETRKHIVLGDTTTVKGALDKLVDAVEKNGANLDKFKEDLAKDNGLTKVGGGEIGLIASENELYKVTVSSLADALALAYSKINALAANMAKKTVAITSSAKLTHTITHNLGTTDLAIDLWIKDGAVWMNHSANMVMVDENTLAVNLSSEAEIKVVITKVEAYTRMI